MGDVEEIVRKLSKAQRAALAAATFFEQHGRWQPEGWYTKGDRRVRYALACLGLTRDYLRPENRLTPLGLRVRDHPLSSKEGE